MKCSYDSGNDINRVMTKSSSLTDALTAANCSVNVLILLMCVDNASPSLIFIVNSFRRMNKRFTRLFDSYTDDNFSHTLTAESQFLTVARIESLNAKQIVTRAFLSRFIHSFNASPFSGLSSLPSITQIGRAHV